MSYSTLTLTRIGRASRGVRALLIAAVLGACTSAQVAQDEGPRSQTVAEAAKATATAPNAPPLASAATPLAAEAEPEAEPSAPAQGQKPKAGGLGLSGVGRAVAKRIEQKLERIYQMANHRISPSPQTKRFHQYPNPDS